jgi:hypothetical protein
MRTLSILLSIAVTQVAAQLPPEEAVCCRSTAQKLIDETQARIRSGDAELAKAQNDLKACHVGASSVVRAEQSCQAERAQLNRVMARQSELNVGLAGLTRSHGRADPGCVTHDILDFENEQLCAPITHEDLMSVASYSCLKGGTHCVFMQCRQILKNPKPAPERTLTINVVGRNLTSSGLQGTDPNYYTDFTVEFIAFFAGTRLTWQDHVRVPSSRSWNTYYYSGCVRVPLREYCNVESKMDYVRGVTLPPHGTNCH